MRPAAAFSSVAASAANSAVTVVPTLAPNVIGNACRSVSIPAPASGTKSDVVIELDWTMTVTTTPTIMAKMTLRPKTLDTIASTCRTMAVRMTFTINSNAAKIRMPDTTMYTTAAKPDEGITASITALMGSLPALIAPLIGLSYSAPPKPPTKDTRAVAVFRNTPVSSSSGSRIKTAR